MLDSRSKSVASLIGGLIDNIKVIAVSMLCIECCS